MKSSVAAAVALSFHQNLVLAATADGGSEVGADVQAMTGDGSEVILSRSSVQDLADSLRGNLFLPGSDAYEKARQVINPHVDKFPALVVQPRSPADVQKAVQYASQENLLTAVKCGGHAFSGLSTCQGGMQIDLSLMRYVRVDPVRKTAWVAGGSLLGEMDYESMAHGLVTTAGTVSHTGVGGLTLGGGYGRLARRFGLTIDSLLSVDIVTADGKLRRASRHDNPDLFWAVRGGGGNFGIVTAFEFQLHPMQRQVIAGRYMFPFERRQEMLQFSSEFASSAPDDLLVGQFIGAFPGGNNVAVIGVVYSGPQERADGLLAPIEKFGPVGNTVKSWDYVELQRSGDFGDDDRANGSYMKSGFIDQISDDLISDLVETFEPNPNRSIWMSFGHGGGAISRVPNDATAFPSRSPEFNLLSFVGWPMGADPEPHLEYMRQQWTHMAPYTDGFYVNDLGEETQAQVDSNYGDNLPRLVQVKNQYDPGNLFRLNANVKPTV